MTCNKSFQFTLVSVIALTAFVKGQYDSIDDTGQQMLFEEDTAMLYGVQSQYQSYIDPVELEQFRYTIEAEKARQEGVIDKMNELEKLRFKMIKQAGKWSLQEQGAQQYLNISSQCDYTCSRQCFKDNQNQSTISTFVHCLVPKCNCMNSFAEDYVPQTQYDLTSDITRINDTIRSAMDQTGEGWPASFRKTLNDVEGYDLIRDCDAYCHRECFDIKKYVPFQTLLQCSRNRCNCWYDLQKPINEQVTQGYLAPQNWTSDYIIRCDQTCALECIRGFVTQKEVDACVREQCGCYEQTDQFGIPIRQPINRNVNLHHQYTIDRDQEDFYNIQREQQFQRQQHQLGQSYMYNDGEFDSINLYKKESKENKEDQDQDRYCQSGIRDPMIDKDKQFSRERIDPFLQNLDENDRFYYYRQVKTPHNITEEEIIDRSLLDHQGQQQQQIKQKQSEKQIPQGYQQSHYRREEYVAQDKKGQHFRDSNQFGQQVYRQQIGQQRDIRFMDDDDEQDLLIERTVFYPHNQTRQRYEESQFSSSKTPFTQEQLKQQQKYQQEKVLQELRDEEEFRRRGGYSQDWLRQEDRRRREQFAQRNPSLEHQEYRDYRPYQQQSIVRDFRPNVTHNSSYQYQSQRYPSYQDYLRQHGYQAEHDERQHYQQYYQPRYVQLHPQQQEQYQREQAQIYQARNPQYQHYQQQVARDFYPYSDYENYPQRIHREQIIKEREVIPSGEQSKQGYSRERIEIVGEGDLFVHKESESENVGSESLKGILGDLVSQDLQDKQQQNKQSESKIVKQKEQKEQKEDKKGGKTQDKKKKESKKNKEEGESYVSLIELEQTDIVLEINGNDDKYSSTDIFYSVVIVVMVGFLVRIFMGHFFKKREDIYDNYAFEYKLKQTAEKFLPCKDYEANYVKM